MRRPVKGLINSLLLEDKVEHKEKRRKGGFIFHSGPFPKFKGPSDLTRGEC